jgi:hypothetical protein
METIKLNQCKLIGNAPGFFIKYIYLPYFSTTKTGIPPLMWSGCQTQGCDGKKENDQTNEATG